MARDLNSLQGNLLFDPTLNRKKKDTAPVRNLTTNDLNHSNSNLTSSFRFDPPGAALKSTQQLNLDFSDFSSHTFFNSAQAKTQKAFGKIINSFPFDGTKSEADSFIDSLTGFEKYVFDAMPHSKGYLVFSGASGPASVGSYISVKDFQGTFSPDLSKNVSGKSVLDFGTGPFTVEFFLNVPSGSVNENSVILQKVNGDDGLTIVLSGSQDCNSPEGEAPLLVMLTSGSLNVTSSMLVQKGQFQHCAFVFDRSAGPGMFRLYRNAVQVATSSQGLFGQIDFVTSPMSIGSGTNVSAGDYLFEVGATLSGAMDELRFWHSAKSQSDIFDMRFRNAFAAEDLALSYRFNEPFGTYTGDGGSMVLDHSGNGLHGRISNFKMALRSSSSFGEVPLLAEDIKYSPVLFPSFADTVNFSSQLLASASSYDFNNPNLVTKLIPRHYLLESQVAEGFEDESGDIGNSMQTSTDSPGGAKMGQAQIISSLLYMMSETFDELKCFVDEFKRLLKVDYVSQDTISDQLLPWLSNYYGVKLFNINASATIHQQNDGQNIRLDGTASEPLSKIQNMLWRRLFSDMPKMMTTRGTMESLKATLRNFGINSDGPVKIRELGGARSMVLGDSFIRRHETAAMLDFSSSLSGGHPKIVSSYLSGSRSEPGFPEIAGSLVDGISDDPSDGLFTSGSWTFEGTYKFLESLSHPNSQSLVRMMTTGSDSVVNLPQRQRLLFNLVAYAPQENDSVTGSISLYGRPNMWDPTTTKRLALTLSGVNIFDGDKWSVSFGRQCSGEIGTFDQFGNRGDSLYFLRASKCTAGGLEQFVVTSSYFYDDYDNPSTNLLSNIDVDYNASGTFLVIGSQSIDTIDDDSIGTGGLNNRRPSCGTPDYTRETMFTGKVSGLRFWSKALTSTESMMHARNFKSLGVEDPGLNFNFVTTADGSFEKLRFDVSTDQIVTMSDGSGDISLFDFSQNGLVFSGSAFEAGQQVIKPERFDFEILSPDFKSENPNKIRIRSYIDDRLATIEGAAMAPLYRLQQNEQPKDDKRVQIEISAVQALNEDITNIFATLDYLDNAIGSPELVFSQDYPSLRHLRRVYFNRLTDKVNFTQVFQFFKWFDETIGDYLEQMLPYDSKFMGSSFVIEPHALERPKFIYNYYDIYLGEEDRGGKDLLLLQQIAGNMRKF